MSGERSPQTQCPVHLPLRVRPWPWDSGAHYSQALLSITMWVQECEATVQSPILLAGSGEAQSESHLQKVWGQGGSNQSQIPGEVGPSCVSSGVYGFSFFPFYLFIYFKNLL